MAKSTIINPAQENERLQALNMPHNLFVVDELLDIDVNYSMGSISLGFKNPAGQLLPVLTLRMPLLFTIELAQKILEEVKLKKEDIENEQKELLQLL